VSLFRRKGVRTQPATPAGSAEERETGLVDSVAGERGISSVNRAASLQTRISNTLAFGLMGSLAVGFLAWYYAHVWMGRSQAHIAAHGTAKNTPQGEMTLPPLGRIDPPKPLPAPPSPSVAETALGPAPPEPAQFEAQRPNPNASPYGVNNAAQTPPKTPAELALERKLAGPVFAGLSNAGLPSASSAGSADGSPRAVPTAERAAEGGDLSALLRTHVTPAVQAQVLATQRLLLPKGAFLDCTLETAIDSTLPGMTTCVLATDAFSADGSVVLLERGTKLVGETRGQVSEGASRLFVLWTEARTPMGVIVPLASPATDELGRSGLAGAVNRHFWQRFGAAILVTVIEGGVQAAVASRSNGTAVIVTPSTTTDITTEVLKSTIAIPPTITKANGDRIQVFVARDLDFRSVYELRPNGR
jgi:type IV secretion system protein VirB10